MNAVFAAWLHAILSALAALFQLALALGMPWGELAWGGSYPGILPGTMRWASLGSAALLLGMAALVLVRAAQLWPAWQAASRKPVWFVVGYCALGVLANAATPSALERLIWLPTVLAMLLTSAVVARSPLRTSR